MATYDAVIGAIGDPAVNQVDPSKSAAAREAFVSFLNEQSEDPQQIAQFMLSELEAGPSEAPFSQLSADRRRQFLRRWIKEAGEVPGLPSPEVPTLEAYLIAERLKPHPTKSAGSCDPEFDEDCGSLSTSGQRVTEQLVPVNLPQSTRHGYVAGSAVTLAAMPFFPGRLDSGPAGIGV